MTCVATPATARTPPRASSRCRCWPTATSASPNWKRSNVWAPTHKLGLSPAELHTVVHDLCQDLLAASDLAWGGSSHVDPRTLAGLLAEVQDPHLQLKVMQLCIAVVETDEHVAEGESAVLAAALTQWGLPQPSLPFSMPDRCACAARR